MKEFILTLLAVTALGSGVHCTQPGTYNVDAHGSVSKGASKELTRDLKSNIIISDYETQSANLNMPGVQYMILR